MRIVGRSRTPTVPGPEPLSVLGAAKASYFEIMCRVLGYPPSLGTFRRFYVNSISNATVCPIFVPWYNDASVKRDSLPSDNLVNLELLDRLDNNRTLIRRYPETFLCLVRLIHMGLLDFVKSADPFKVNTGERTLAEGEASLFTKTVDMVVTPSAQTIRLVSHTIIDELQEHAEKKKRKVVFDAYPVNKVRTDGVVISKHVPTIAEFVSSSVTPTPEDSGSTQDVNVQGRRPPDRLVVVTSSSEHVKNVEDDAAEFVGGVRASSIPGGNVGTSASAPGSKSPAALRNQTDARFLDGFNIKSAHHVCMIFELRLRYEHEIMSKKRFQKKFTESSAVIHQRDAKIVSLKSRLETTKKVYAEVNGLCGRVSKLEVEVVAKSLDITRLNKQNAELLGKVSTLEAMRDELSGQVAKLRADYEKLRGDIDGEAKMREEFASLQDVAAWRFKEWSTKLDARIADIRRDVDTDLYPHMLTAIAGRRLVLGHGIRLAVMKCAQYSECRSALGKVEACDPEIESKYVAAVREFENVYFSFLEELETLKDSPLDLIMSALTLEGDANSTLELRKLQPSLDQVTVPVYSESSGSRGPSSISHEMLLSDAIPAIRGRAKERGLVPSFSSAAGGVAGIAPAQNSSLGVTDYQISTLVYIGDAVPVTQPHDDLFDTTVLDVPRISRLLSWLFFGPWYLCLFKLWCFISWIVFVKLFNQLS
ncbi:hypothetical protein Tco_0668828 [Tanacetum coccineum]